MKDSTQPKSKVTFRRVATWIALGVVALLVVSSIASAMMPKPVPVDVTQVVKGPMSVTVNEDGRTRVKDRYVVSAPLAGTLARLKIAPGDEISSEGEVARVLPLPAPLLDPQSRAKAIARLAAAEAAQKQAQATVSRAKAAVEFSEAEIKQQEDLSKQGAIPKHVFERAKMELRTQREDLASASFGARVARHEVDLTRAALGRLGSKKGSDELLIQSPIEGLVLEVRQQSEGVVQPGTPLVEIGDPRALELVVDVLTTDAVRIKPGAKAKIQRWGGAGELAAHVRRVEPKAFTRVSSLGVEEQRVNVLLDLDSPPAAWSSLGDGFRIEASITTWEAPDVLRVPASSVFRRGEDWVVFVVEDDRAALRKVAIGQRNGAFAQITEGLMADETVINHPGERVVDGALVSALGPESIE